MPERELDLSFQDFADAGGLSLEVTLLLCVQLAEGVDADLKDLAAFAAFPQSADYAVHQHDRERGRGPALERVWSAVRDELFAGMRSDEVAIEVRQQMHSPPAVDLRPWRGIRREPGPPAVDVNLLQLIAQRVQYVEGCLRRRSKPARELDMRCRAIRGQIA